MSCLKSLGVVLALQVAAAWATVQLQRGRRQLQAAVNSTRRSKRRTSAPMSSSSRNVGCTASTWSKARGAYFIFTDGEDGVPCKTRTLDGQVLNGACHQGLCTVKDGAGAAPHSAAGAAAGAATPASAAGAAAAGAVTPGAVAHPAAAAVTPAHAAAPGHPAAPAAATAKHKKA
ncbi:hypothetical protein MTO96_005628 [Rhipicephalus appendiculatus]